MKTRVLSSFVSVPCATILILAMTLLVPSSAPATPTMPTPFPIATTAGKEMAWGYPAFDGTNFMVCIQGDSTTANAITAQRVSRSGALVGSLISVGTIGGGCSVAFDGTNYLLAWADAANPATFIKGQFVSTAGVLVGVPFTIATATDERNFRILFDGTNHFVVWEERLPGIRSNLYGQFITKSGAKLGSVVDISTAAEGQRAPAIAFDGENILAIWVDGRNRPGFSEKDVYGQFITKSSASVAGTLSGGNFLINASELPRDHTGPAIAFDGTNYLVVITEPTVAPPACNSSSDCRMFIVGQIVNKSGANVGSAITISIESNWMFGPTVASDRTNFLVTWTDIVNDASNFGVCDSGEGSCWDIWGQSVSKTGGLVDSAFAISSEVGNQFGGVVYGGEKYFVGVNSFDSFEGPLGDVFGMMWTASWRSGEVDKGNGWKKTTWFGLYNTSFEPWIYHVQHGWLYPYDNGDGAVFFWYSDMNQFVWTTPTTYPFLYRFGAAPAWLWYVKDSANPRSFYNYTSGIWETLP